MQIICIKNSYLKLQLLTNDYLQILETNRIAGKKKKKTVKRQTSALNNLTKIDMT